MGRKMISLLLFLVFPLHANEMAFSKPFTSWVKILSDQKSLHSSWINDFQRVKEKKINQNQFVRIYRQFFSFASYLEFCTMQIEKNPPPLKYQGHLLQSLPEMSFHDIFNEAISLGNELNIPIHSRYLKVDKEKNNLNIASCLYFHFIEELVHLEEVKASSIDLNFAVNDQKEISSTVSVEETVDGILNQLRPATQTKEEDKEAWKPLNNPENQVPDPYYIPPAKLPRPVQSW
jgi:dimeric dUTPase (all-alpha-NTP-PPase superfamily)